MARTPRKEGARKKRGNKGASGRRGAPKLPRKRARKSAAKLAKTRSNRRAPGDAAALKRELSEARAGQAATDKILDIIASARGDLSPVFAAIVESAVDLCAARFGAVFRMEGDLLHLVADRNFGQIQRQLLGAMYPMVPSRGHISGRAILNRAAVQIPDIYADEHYKSVEAKKAGFRSLLATPLLRGSKAIGSIVIYRTEAGAFTESQSALLQSFAAHAVIAIENARLFNETNEALERQTATADILKVIASSPDDVKPVFEAIAESARRVIGGHSALVTRLVGEEIHLAAFTTGSDAGRERLLKTYPQPLSSRVLSAQVLRTGQVVFYADTEQDADDLTKEFARARGYRSVLAVPMLRDGAVIGTINVTRAQPSEFDENTVGLLKTFADQAVIAIENARLFNETKEALARQTATADVLKVIASSPSNLQPVFDAIAARSNELIGGHSTTVGRYVDGMVQLAAFTPVSPEADAKLRTMFPSRPTDGDPQIARVLRGEIARIAEAETEIQDSAMRETARARGWCSRLIVPLKDDTAVIGWISVTRKETGEFADKDVELLRTFADQAVIAIQNVELFEEVQLRTRDLQESLQQQTATADVLKVISRSAFDLQTVLDTLVESAYKLCGASLGLLYLRSDKDFECKAIAGVGVEAATQLFMGRPIRAGRGTAAERVILTGEVHAVTDFFTDPAFDPVVRERIRNDSSGSDISQLRSTLAVPMTRESEVVGVLVIARTQTGPFPQRQVELLQTFADQAVIAIENLRLFNETKEALARQTATADVLKVIASSPSNLQPVFDAIAERSKALIGGHSTTVFRFAGEMVELVGATSVGAEADAVLRSTFPMPVSRMQNIERVLRGEVAEIVDAMAGTEPDASRNVARARGWRSRLVVPLKGDNEVIGFISITRKETGGFVEKDVELVRTFADQAVIAIQNVELFEEVQERTRDLQESLQQQTATADVLKVISRSAFDLDTVMNTLAHSARALCGSKTAGLFLRDGDMLVNRGSSAVGQQDDEFIKANPVSLNEESHMGRALLTGTVANIADFENDPRTKLRKFQQAMGFRAFLAVPLMREGRGIGVFALTRDEVGAFSERQVELVEGFADQAVIAIENVRLFEEVQAKTRELEQSLDDLRAAQDRLVQTEKLASLGQLTAGIAHEIKNPLNFINNFSALSVELTEELNDVLKQAELTKKIEQEVGELTQLLKSNLEKVVQHGKRADSIVKNMLLHSHEGSGEQRATDVNALVEESLNLAYHGARAEKSGFNITLQRDFDAGAGSAELFPQEITRALLNLISNGFYAATRRKAENGDGAFEPTLLARTRDLGGSVEIRIRDNGTGIPPEVKEKMFNPFFTTKPAGEGTGLGLSMTHDIIVKQHGGTIDVTTEPGDFTEFIVVLPRANGGQGKTRGPI